MFTSGTVAAAREAALLGKPAIAISQYVKKGMALDWNRSIELARPVLQELLGQAGPAKGFWNVNLPHVENGVAPATVLCEPDNQPLDVRYRREGDQLHYAGSYHGRSRTPGRDIDHCFEGAITISHLEI
jgi:5'-nucleotidase